MINAPSHYHPQALRPWLARLGLAALLGVAALTGAPESASANRFGQHNRVEKSHGFFSSLWGHKKKDRGWGKETCEVKEPPSTVPELDASVGGQALGLLAGGLAVALGTRRRRTSETL